MLGHANLNTTQIYTQVSIRQLQNVHRLTHPAEKTTATVTEKDSPPPSPGC
jgi:integrase/recombinase XerD